MLNKTINAIIQVILNRLSKIKQFLYNKYVIFIYPFFNFFDEFFGSQITHKTSQRQGFNFTYIIKEQTKQL